MRRVNFLLLIIVLAATVMVGCTTFEPATPLYKSANKQRLATVKPMLQTYGTDHPASAQNVSDILTSWDAEVAAQQRSATTAPVK